jgi:hypothetical protein
VRYFVLILAAALLAVSANAADILRGDAELSFERDKNGDVWADFDMTFRNTTGKTLCLQEGSIPGTGDFHVELIEMYGPKGKVPVSAGDPYWRTPGQIERDALRAIVILRDQEVKQGMRFGKDDYVFSEPGTYKAVLRINLYDCAMVENLRSPSWYQPKLANWYLGDLVFETAAPLN